MYFTYMEPLVATPPPVEPPYKVAAQGGPTKTSPLLNSLYLPPTIPPTPRKPPPAPPPPPPPPPPHHHQSSTGKSLILDNTESSEAPESSPRLMKRPVAMLASSELEASLIRQLRDAPHKYGRRYTDETRRSILRDLFTALACGKREYLNFLFPNGPPDGIGDSSNAWNLSVAQGAVEGAEYSEAARGKPCGHILKTGEATYRCKTCSLDETCVLCAKCFEASDHTGHVVYVNITPGNTGCCDCGDAEAWRTPVKCAIHTPLAEGQSRHMDPESNPELPKDFITAIRSTVARALDYMCDVVSCSPEQLRLPKTVEAIMKDEEQSRLTNRYFESESYEHKDEYALVLWNDEKHTIDDVEAQVARACKKTKKFGKERAQETDHIGRSIVIYSFSIEELLRISKIIEQIKITVTIRSARDIFREQMCGTIIEWLGDIAGCSAGGDNDILRTVICEELLGVWRVGSLASNTEIGKKGLDDHAMEEDERNKEEGRRMLGGLPIGFIGVGVESDDMEVDGEGEGMEAEDDDDDDDDGDRDDDVDMVGVGAGRGSRGQGGESEDDIMGAQTEETPHGRPVNPTGELGDEMQQDDEDDNLVSRGIQKVPRTPNTQPSSGPPAPQHWLDKPTGYITRHPLPPHEDLRQRVRLDWLILFDLRLWKKARIDLRDLYISTVVAIPEFKRILGLRFAGLYTILSQLYLIPDREPDHSIISLSLQILTTPTITAEVVRRGNFLTNLMAILYTFLTTRQVGHPHEVNEQATLAIDTGSLTNRRIYHFFTDIKYLLNSPYVQERLRKEKRYLLQFLDLARLHQGICPNVRAVNEHVEYEAEAWITASLVTREINKLTRQFPEAFKWSDDPYDNSLQSAITTVTQYTIVSSMGWEKYRFRQTEIKSETEFKRLGGFEFDTDDWGNQNYYQIVKFAVDRQPLSFHHALHYTLSWLVESGKAMSVDVLRQLLKLNPDHTKGDAGQQYDWEDLAISMFDYPLRVCVWLAQMKAGMWVRNGFSLRHQMQTYKNVSQRDLTHNRDIFMLQTALVTVEPRRMLVTMIDRFNLCQWMQGNYHPDGYEEIQVLDLAEDFLHLLIVLLSDRLPLIPLQEEPDLQVLKLKREIVHILCFKPIQFSELCNRLPERLQDHERFQEVLGQMTVYRPPDGLSDSGTFELRDEFQGEVDPYIMQFSKNQREETESNYCARISKKTGVPQADVVFEPRLRPIHTGVFADIAAFTRTPIFAQIIYYSLAYALQFKAFTPGIPESRIETFLQVCLHLCQLAVIEDTGSEDHDSFILYALEKQARGVFGMMNTQPTEAAVGDNCNRTIATVLHKLSSMESFKACHPKIKNVLRRMRQKRQVAFDAGGWAHDMEEKMDMELEQTSKEAEVERKKLLAKERQAKIMAQMKQQQQNFLSSAGFDFGSDDYSGSEDDEFMETEEEQKKWWKYPTGTCILCQEEMNDSRLYGTLALITETNILRQTPIADPDYIYEIAKTPDSLDRPADEIRPFGVASMNRDSVKKLAADGSEVIAKRQGLGKGFPPKSVKRGPVAIGCSHIMHFSCFEHYYESTRRRHPHQIARAHPERLQLNEFVCPLCKALGNTFLPIIWKSKEETLTGVLQPSEKFEVWLGEQIGPMVSRLEKVVESGDGKNSVARSQEMFTTYGQMSMIQPIGSKIHYLGTMNIDQIPDGRTSPSYSFGLSHEIPPRPSVVIPSLPQTEIDELHKIYRRLRDTLTSNKIYSRFESVHDTIPGPSLTHCDSLARIWGYSISSVEIAQRGIGSDPGLTLLDKISQQVLTHLRILSETIFSYFSVGGLQNIERNKTIYQFKEIQQAQMQQLFVGHPQICDDVTRQRVIATEEPLLVTDLFVFLAECSICLIPALNLDVMHVLRLCYVAEIVKVTIAIKMSSLEQHIQKWGPREVESLGDLSEGQIPCTEHQLNTFRDFIDFLGRSYGRNWSGELSSESFPLAIFRTLVTKYTTPFLRKCVILLHTRYGILFPNTGFEDLFETEASRLSKAMGLPDLDHIFASSLGETQDGKFMRPMISGWCRHWANQKHDLMLSHPSIFELVGLPLHFDTLVEEAMKRRCPSTGKDLTEPTVCLFCGEVFCSQAFCCTEGNRGGCNQHLDKCGKDVGLFMNIKKCCVLYLHNGHGSFATAPFLDKHGETDWGLRRNRQLFLNQRRYDALLRNTWIQHGIASVISRKLEAEINNGGWETM